MQENHELQAHVAINSGIGACNDATRVIMAMAKAMGGESKGAHPATINEAAKIYVAVRAMRAAEAASDSK